MEQGRAQEFLDWVEGLIFKELLLIKSNMDDAKNILIKLRQKNQFERSGKLISFTILL